MFKYQNVSKIEFVISLVFMFLCMSIGICCFSIAAGTATTMVKVVLVFSIIAMVSMYTWLHSYVRF